MTDFLKAAKRILQSLWDASALMYRVSPRRSILMWLVVIVLAGVPTALLLVQRAIVDHLAESIQPSGAEIWTFVIIAIVVMFALLNTLSELGDSLQVAIADQLRDEIATHTAGALLTRVGEWETLDLHENPAALDTLRLGATGQTGYRQLTWGMFSTVTGLLSLVPLIAVLGTVAWWMPLVTLLAIAPGIWMTIMLPRLEWREREKLAQDERKRDLYYQMVTFPEYARDLRLFQMMPSRISAWRELALPILLKVNQVRFALLRRILVWSTLIGFVIVIPLVWLINNAASGEISLGDVVLVIGSLAALRGAIWYAAGNGATIADALTGIGHYRAFMALEPTASRGTNSTVRLPNLSRELAIEAVSFAYPGASEPVLENISIELRAGESVAIVGENGAGKTTLTRLLTRLFDAPTGEIRWDDTSIYDVSPTELRSKLAVIPQDFARFPLTLRENVAVGRLNNPPDDDEIEHVLRAVGLESLLTLNAAPLDTPLTKELNDGTQLSGGQWQRIAIARAMVRAPQAEVVIMDEPTAALDPHTEVDIAKKMLDVAQGKTAIVISHRLGICTLVDRVLVMEHGNIVEDGSHSTLMAQNGAYAAMFRAQSSWYT